MSAQTTEQVNRQRSSKGFVQEVFEGVVSGLTDQEMPLPDSFKQAVKSSAQEAIKLTEWLGETTYTTIEQATESIGNTLTPVAENPVVRSIAKVPGLNWLLLWLGQVDIQKAQADVNDLRLKYPTENDSQIAQRVVDQMAVEAAKVGLLTNIIPPVALALLAVDLVAVTKLQAEMVYRIAAAYQFSLDEPIRRGEVIAIYGLSFGSASPIKAGLSFVELLPIVGAAVGASSDAILIYTLGLVARQFYEEKRSRQHTVSETNSSRRV